MANALPVWLPVIKAVCVAHFGTRAKKYADNRCGACPLREPCLKHGRCPARTIEELTASRETFDREALAILAVR